MGMNTGGQSGDNGVNTEANTGGISGRGGATKGGEGVTDDNFFLTNETGDGNMDFKPHTPPAQPPAGVRRAPTAP
jgi:hypothetical protein